MRLKIILLIVISVVSVLFSQNFECKLEYTCGMKNVGGKSDYELTFGMNELASPKLDKDFDVPAPPIPPEVCYTMFIAPEGNPPFNLLWTDIRESSDFEVWTLNTIRNDGGGAITFDNTAYPDGYTIWIGGINPAFSATNIIRVHPEDANLEILAIKGKHDSKYAISKDPDIKGKATLTIESYSGEFLEEINLKLEKDSKFIFIDLKYKSQIVKYKLESGKYIKEGMIYCI